MNKEIEKKYFVSKVPNLEIIQNIKIYRIIQQYLYQDDFTVIRKRKILDLQNEQNVTYIYTVKTKGDITNKNAIYEIETAISKEQYEAITDNREYIVDKIRLKIPIANHFIAELDIYYGKLEGLATVEVEFEEEVQMEQFKKPEWIGQEIDKKEFSNGRLSKLKKEEFLTLLDEEKRNNNLQIKNEIEKYIQKNQKL